MLKVTTLYSGSGGNSTLVQAEGVRLLIDAGSSCRRLLRALEEQGVSADSLSAVLVTHSHSDHVSALRVLEQKCPFLPIYATPRTAEDAGLTRALPLKEGVPLFIKKAQILPFSTPHDAPGSVGFRVECACGSLGYATDIGFVSEEVECRLSGCPVVVLESNYDMEMLQSGPYPYHLKQRIQSKQGHLDNALCAQFALRLAQRGTKQLILAHLSRENNSPSLAYGATAAALRAGGVTQADVYLQVAPAEAAVTAGWGK